MRLNRGDFSSTHNYTRTTRTASDDYTHTTAHHAETADHYTPTDIDSGAARAAEFPDIRKEISEIGPLALVGLFALSYFFAAIVIGIRAPLWMDEVMADWMSQLSPRVMWLALNHGAMSSPPTYFLMLKMVRGVFGSSHVVLRLPSVFGGFVTGLAAYMLMRRRFSIWIAGLALALCLGCGLFTYATQVREYTLVTACFALAVLVWDTNFGDRFSPWRFLLIALFLALCGALHFYGVLLIVVFTGMELLWLVARQKIRKDIWGAITLAGALFLLWLPLIHNITKIIGKEASAPGYFAPPTFGRLLAAYVDLALGERGWALLCLLVGLVLLASFADHLKSERWRMPERNGFAGDRRAFGGDLNFTIILAATTAIPVVVFLFAKITHGTFNGRYAAAACFGFAMLFAFFVSRLRHTQFIACALLLGSILLMADAPRRLPVTDRYEMNLMAETHDAAPIVVGEGLAFIELQERTSPELKARLVYLKAPPDEVNPDPTNEDAVNHWSEFRPDLKVFNAEEFVQQTPHFYLLHSDATTDVITPWLMRNMSLRPLWERGGLWFFEGNAGNPTR
ncbi:MAG TPA: glycosyltransferase family 39 protein [Candidatus Acidoferrales bacterium]|jgi:hypothetical protein|nr:glycosyltransferase family 39 protein [Candidatus Acidoferrales bacterium]